MRPLNYHNYSFIEKKWLKENIDNYTYKDLTTEFNKEFGTNVSMQSVSDHCTRILKLHRNTNTGIFTKGKNVFVNKPIGTEIKAQGYTYVKINDIYHEGKKSSKHHKENWVLKQRYIYEQHYGKIPKGNIVVFLDNNTNNFDINNLYSIDRGIHVQMCKNRWYTTSREHTLTAIKLCELKRLIKE